MRANDALSPHPSLRTPHHNVRIQLYTINCDADALYANKALALGRVLPQRATRVAGDSGEGREEGFD